MNPNKALWEKGGVPAEEISFAKDTFVFRSPDKTPTEYIEEFRRYYGPTMNAFEAAEKNGKVEELRNQLVVLADAKNTSTTGGLAISATFLRVTVTL